MSVQKAIDEKVHPYVFAGCTENAEVDMETIVQLVFEHKNLNPLLAYSKCRKHDVSHARQIVMYLAYINMKTSYPVIAKQLNRKDHTTIHHGINNIKGQMQVDKQIRAEINGLNKQLSNLKVIGKKK